MVLPVLNDAGFRIECYDAADVGKGPLATLRLRERHAALLAALRVDPVRVAGRRHERNRFSSELERIARAARRPRRVAREVARELDEGIEMV